jgi:class 3 adenylate cyclase
MPTCQNRGRETPGGFAFCGHCGFPLATTPARDFRKTVTIVFADVVGSTSLGETRDPEQVRAQQEARGVLEQMVAWSEAKGAVVYADQARASIAEL